MFRLFKYGVVILSTLFVVIAFMGCKRETTIYLDTSIMQEADDNIIDSTMGPTLISLFLCQQKNTKNDAIAWADVFLCVKNSNYGSQSDTVLLLDTALRKMQRELRSANYWTGLKKAAKLKRCKILIPASFQDKIKRYKYKYCSVMLVTDDFDYRQ